MSDKPQHTPGRRFPTFREQRRQERQERTDLLAQVERLTEQRANLVTAAQSLLIRCEQSGLDRDTELGFLLPMRALETAIKSALKREDDDQG